MDEGAFVDVVDGGQDALFEFPLRATRICRSKKRASLEKKPPCASLAKPIFYTANS
jgi:hypothetical protein